MENLDERYQIIIALLHKYLGDKYNINEFDVMKPEDDDWMIITIEEPPIRFTVLRDHEWPDIKTSIEKQFKILEERKNAHQNLDLMKTLISKYIKRKYKIDDVIFTEPVRFQTGLVVSLPTIKTKFAILHNKIWREVQTYIDDILLHIANRDKLTECPICFETKLNSHFTGCSECYHKRCVECMANMIRANRGLCVCPFCKHTIGHEMPSEVVERFIDMLNEKNKYTNNVL